MVRIRLPSGLVFLGLIAPGGPAFARAAREEFEVRAGAAGFDDVVGFVWLA